MSRLTKLRHALADMNYAQRRLLEIRTGVQTTDREAIGELEASFAGPARSR